jgi:hypothetical protein
VGARQVELATAIHSAIAVIIGFALEQPLITHRVDPPLINISCASETVCLGVIAVKAFGLDGR